MDESLNKLWYIHAMDYFSAIIRNELLSHKTTWMNPRELCWVKKANPKRLHTVWFHLYDILEITKLHNLGWGRRKVGMTAKGKHKGTVLYLDYIYPDCVIVYSFARYFILREPGEGCMGSPYIISSICRWVHSYIKMKSLIKNIVAILWLKKWNFKEKLRGFSYNQKFIKTPFLEENFSLLNSYWSFYWLKEENLEHVYWIHSNRINKVDF